MKFFIVTTFTLMSVFVSITSHADSFKTVLNEEKVEGVYELYASYPQLLPESAAPAYNVISKQIEEMATEGCGLSADEVKKEIEEFYGADAQISYYASVSARIVGLNKNYVGVEATTSSYCGGAHPNYGTYYMTFDSKTGEQVLLDSEIPVQDLSGDNWDKFHAYQKELAQIIYKNIGSEIAKDADAYSGCYSGQTKQEVLESLESFFPLISGYAANKTVVLTVNPPHVATPCALSVRVPFAEVEKYFAPNAKAKKWLK